MNQLALDTSTHIATVALSMGDTILSRSQDGVSTHAKFILPMIDAVLKEGGLTLKEVDVILFGCGPGSFTGLRVACSVTKALAYGQDKGVIPVSSLQTMAFKARKSLADFDMPVLAMLDARMGEVYWRYDAGQIDAVEQVSQASDIVIVPERPFVVASYGTDDYYHLLPEQVREACQAHIKLYPDASSMIEWANQAKPDSMSAQSASPVYIRNNVVQGGKRG